MKKVQLYADPIKDEVVFKLIDRLEKESQNTRGYVQNQIKERLKAFELLAKEVGSDDPMEIVLSYMKGLSNIEKQNKSNLKENDNENSIEVDAIDPKAAKLAESAENGYFGI